MVIGQITMKKNNSMIIRKAGFVIEGIKRNSLLIDSKYVDEYYMARVTTDV
jgi:hypothetical protein